MKLKIKKSTWNGYITYGIVLAAYLIIQLLTVTDNISSLFEGLLVPICTYIVLAVSLNLVVGFLGELSLGHAGFMCVGAFVGAFFSKCMEMSIPNVWIRFPLAFILGGLAAAAAGIIIGIPVLRLRGDYLAIVTLAFGEIIKNVLNVIYVGIDKNGLHFSLESSAALNLDFESGTVIIDGALGITGTPQNSNFTVGIVLVFITLFVIMNIVKSRAGRAIMAVRDNRIAAEAVGINVTKYRLTAFTVSAFFAGIAGVLYAHNLTTLSAQPSNFGYNASITILVFVVLGGIGSIRGSIISAAVLTILPEILRGLRDYRMLIYAVVLIIIMLFTSSPQLIALREKIIPKGFIKKLMMNKSNKSKEV